MKKNCIACHSSRISLYFKANKTVYYRCHDCTHVFAFKVSSMPYEQYDHDAKYTRWREYLFNIFERRVNDLRVFKKKGKVLEVGCSVGFMLEVLRKKGYVAEGLEPSLDGVKIARSKGFTVYQGYLENKKIAGSPYDALILNHVFEHLPDLYKGCGSIQKLLKKNGVVLINCPNFGSLEGEFLKASWRFLQPHEHFSQFTPRSMQTVLEKNGFEILSLRTNSPLYDFADLPRELWRCLIHDQKRLLYYGLEFPLATLEWILNRGKEVEVIARKKA